MTDILNTDNRLSKELSFHEDKILIKSLTNTLSKQAGVKISVHPYYSNQYVFLRFNNKKVSHIMEALCSLYQTYWERTKKGYVLQQTVHGIKNLFPTDANKLRRMEVLSRLSKNLQKAPPSVRDSLSFSEGSNPAMIFNQLPSNLKNDVIEVIKIHASTESSQTNPKVQSLYDDFNKLNIGFRTTSSDSSPFEKMEFMGFRDNAFFSIAISDVPKKLEEQERSLSGNNPDTYSYRLGVVKNKDRFSRIAQISSLNKEIDFQISRFTHPRALAEIYKSVPELNLITFVENYAMEKRDFSLRGEKLSALFEKIGKSYSDLDWSVTVSNIVVFHVRFAD